MPPVIKKYFFITDTIGKDPGKMGKRLVALPGFVKSKWLEVVQKSHGEVPGLVFVAKGFGTFVADTWYLLSTVILYALLIHEDHP